jgi:hypothetical protein
MMNAVIVLLALSAFRGFALRSFAWFAIGISGLVLAVVSSAALHIQGFGAVPGIAFVVACLTVNQIAYLIGLLGNQHLNRPVRKDSEAKSSWFA